MSKPDRPESENDDSVSKSPFLRPLSEQDQEAMTKIARSIAEETGRTDIPQAFAVINARLDRYDYTHRETDTAILSLFVVALAGGVDTRKFIEIYDNIIRHYTSEGVSENYDDLV